MGEEAIIMRAVAAPARHSSHLRGHDELAKVPLRLAIQGAGRFRLGSPMTKLLSVALFSLLSLATAIPAQIALPVSLSGRLEAAPADACDPAATHRIACTDVLLKSSSVDLAAFNGRIVDMTGALDALSPCTTIEVDSIATSRAPGTWRTLGAW